jgi:hypothetical protein
MHLVGQPKILGDLDLYLLNTRDPATKEEVDLVEKAFLLWRDTWKATFGALKVTDADHHLHSDDFLGREALALFEDRQPVGLIFCHPVELRESQLSHSYFKAYPEDVINRLRHMGFSRCVVLSYITVRSDFRKANTDVPMYELLFSLGVKRFRNAPQECMIGYIRTDLSFHGTFARHGGLHIGKSHVYNVDVDYLCMTKQSMCLSPLPGVADTANVLWEKMLFRDKATAGRALKAA